MRAPFYIVSFLLFFSVSNPIFPQSGGSPRAGAPSRHSAEKEPKSQKSNDSGPELASFSGVVRVIDRKNLLLKLADDHVLKFDRSGKTRFFKDSSKVKASAVHAGDLVTIEASQDLDGTLEAVNVRLEQDPAAKVTPPVPDGK